MTRRLLLVEDDEASRDMLARRLVRRGYVVATAGDGRAALAVAAAEPPELVIMDMSLPLLDGYEATRLLKATPVTRGVPVVGLSAHAMAGDREKALAAGCDDYLTKPVDFVALQTVLARLLPADD
jgi:CheY-like chemotaxis protein